MEAADQGAKPHLTMANEDYLECIVRIEAEGPDQGTDGIRSVEIAQRLDVSKASVNKAIASLKSQVLNSIAQMRRRARWSTPCPRTPWIAGSPTWSATESSSLTDV